MDCGKFHKDLEDYLEGGLDFAGRFGMERHARQCYVCGREAADAQKLSELAARLQRVVAPPNFEEKVLARIHTREPRFQFWRPWAYGLDWFSGSKLALAASGLVLLVLGVILASGRLHWSDRDLPLASERAAGAKKDLAARSVEPSRELGDGGAPAAKVDNASSLEQVVEPVLAAKPVPALPRRSRNSKDDGLAADFRQPADSDYVEYSVPGPGGRALIMRLPKTIRMRYGQPSEEYFIRNVSH